MGIGHGAGEARAADAARQAIMSQLFEQSIDGARGVLFTITGGADLTLFEMNEAAEIIHAAAADPEARIIFGAVIDERMGSDVKISVIATGFDSTRPLKRIEQLIYRRQTEPRQAERQTVAAGASVTNGTSARSEHAPAEPKTTRTTWRSRASCVAAESLPDNIGSTCTPAARPGAGFFGPTC